LQDFVETIKLKENSVLKKLKEEVVRFKKFQLALSGKSTEIDVSEKDLRNYFKFVLEDGDINERRNLLESLESKLHLKHKKIYLSK